MARSVERPGGARGRCGKRKGRRRSGSGTRSRAGHFISPDTMLSEKSREKEEQVAVIKLVVALLLTLVAVIVIVKVTQKGFGSPPPGSPVEAPENR